MEIRMNALFNLFGSKKTSEPEPQQPQEPKPLLDENFIKTGEVVIDGIRIYPNINLDEYAKLTRFSRYSGFRDIFYPEEGIEIYEEKFDVEVIFENGKLAQIILKPIIGDRMPKEYDAYGSKEAVQFIKDLSREWLIKQLGKPHVDSEDDTGYNYNWGGVGTTYSEPDLHGIRHGGDICIGYV